MTRFLEACRVYSFLPIEYLKGSLDKLLAVVNIKYTHTLDLVFTEKDTFIWCFVNRADVKSVKFPEKCVHPCLYIIIY